LYSVDIHDPLAKKLPKDILM